MLGISIKPGYITCVVKTLKIRGETRVEQFLYREARLLDERRFEEWIRLFTNDGYYWVPGAVDQEDPFHSVSIFYDDKALLETRIQRLRHPKIHSQEPPSRTCHFVSNIEIDTEHQHESELLVLSAQLMTEFRQDKQRIFSSRCRHLLRENQNSYKIVWKRVDLINCDGILESLTIPF